MIDYKKISEELDFNNEDTQKIVECMQSVVNGLDTTTKIIDYWNNNCFRASNTKEIIEQFDDITDIKEVGNRIFVIRKDLLISIGIGLVMTNYDIGYKYLEKIAKEDEAEYYEIVEDSYKYENGLTLIEYADKEKEHEIEVISIDLDNLEEVL